MKDVVRKWVAKRGVLRGAVFNDPAAGAPDRARSKKYCPPAALIAALMLAALSTGCTESVDPIIGTDLPFTIWGFMNAGADTQYVRVYQIADRLHIDTTTSIDAEVSSTDLTTGERREWSYKTIFVDSVTTGHIFWSPFRAEHQHRYRLEVVRSDGSTSSAEATVPSEVDFQIDVDGNRSAFPVQIEGDVPNIVGLRVTYHAINVPPALVWPPTAQVHPPVLHSVTVPYDEKLTRIGDRWTVTVNMVQDTAAVREAFRANCLITGPGGSAPDIWLRGMEFTAVAADSAWNPPGGVFDPDVLAVPGTMSNVENGYGFMGAGQGIRYVWEPSPEVRLSVGYDIGPQCTLASGGARPVPECMNPPIPCIGENVEDVWQLWLR